MKTIARRLLPTDLKKTIRTLFSKFDSLLLGILSKPLFLAHPGLSNSLYRLFNGKFNREQQAVLAGRLAYIANTGVGENSSALLRRNTHRLEKGLSMQPRREVFAEEFIVETANCFSQCVTADRICEQELKWAEDVLNSYFSSVTHTANIAEAYGIFSQACQSGESVCEQLSVPYEYQELTKSEIDTDAFTALCKQRRAVRWFTNQQIADADINRAIEIASLAPSACNRQPFEFYVANDRELAPSIAKFAGGTSGFVDNIPCTIVVVGDLSAYPAERDRHVIYIDGSLAAMQLMLALETMGLSSCPINWPDLDVPEQKMAKRLGLKAYERPIMLIAVGYAAPEGMIPFSQKKRAGVLRKDI
ncbi:nitroreductase family protein [Shewanella atlantica]|uniref:nitroreductase family protein n=1 Tax=Shewanella atlantica TaxID=271099 RepID=UPI0037360AED